ncbi:alpha/beta fold hydrolase [Dankookia sp. P2]|uniref:alpha/beta fold hydrolase n=1 Tax=Dankookia sp. P2 TaxID=3423955 RepID=UPI003D66E3E4
MGLIRAAGLRRPVVLGASMSGEICLELALRHPDAFRGIVACEASDHIEGRKTPGPTTARSTRRSSCPNGSRG